MRRFFHSFYYFILLPFKKVEVDILFYAPSHFNRGQNLENLFFEPLLESCRRNNKTFIVFEEPSLSNNIRNPKAIPFDFIFRLVIVLRKIMKVENDIIETENRIGLLLSKIFFRNFKYSNYIVLSKSMISVFSKINPEAKLFDLQHGIINTNKPDYFPNGELSLHLKRNNVFLLLSGKKYKDVLMKNDCTNFINEKSSVIGVVVNREIIHLSANKNVLVTLQFTEDNTKENNDKLLKELTSVILHNNGLNFYLKNHPRFNGEVDLTSLFDNINVKQSPLILQDCFNLCSLHLTAFSTTTFECALQGIPTIFLKSLENKFDMFVNEFNYPLENNFDLVLNNYSEYSLKVREWSEGFYCDFNDNKFISLLK